MKIGDFTFKRRYSFAQIIVDVASVAALLYIFFIVYVCAVDIKGIKSLNVTDASLDSLRWEPLIIWCVLGVIVWAVSVLLLLLPRKMSDKLVITETTAPKYCNIVDTCISCLRLVLLLAVSELCYMHMQSVMLREVQFSVHLVLQAVIAALLIWFTAVRLDSLSQTVVAEQGEKKKREIIEN